MRVESTKYPELLVTDLRVQFGQGAAEVDEATADALRGLAHIGVVVPEAPKRARKKPVAKE